MFNLVIYITQFIRKMKEYNIVVSQQKFVNDAKYRQDMLNEGKTMHNKDLPEIIKYIERDQYKLL